MTHNAVGRQGRGRRQQRLRQVRERDILPIRIRQIVRAFEFDADRKIVAGAAAAILRNAGVPGALTQRHELRRAAVPIDKHVRAHASARDCREVRMHLRGQVAAKQPLNPAAAELRGRQTDTVNHNQLGHAARWPRIKMRRKNLPYPDEQAGSDVNRIGWGYLFAWHALSLTVAASCDNSAMSGSESNASLCTRDLARVWHPCTQMKDHEAAMPMIPIKTASGVWLEDHDGHRYIDAISSWWVNLHGHAHPRINAALSAQLSRLEHVMLAGFTHEPAVQLAEQLCALAPRGLTRCFFADSGSAAIEIAVKMSFHFWQNRGRPRKTRFVTLANSYHGETLGALAVGSVELYKAIYRPLLMDVLTVPSPDAYEREPGCTAAEHAERMIQPLRDLLASRHEEISAVLIEPLVQCAGGMRMHDPRYLTLLRALCDRYDVHLIADEIAVGFGRTGTMFACEQAAIRPDFMCLSKGITAGYLPLSVVLTTEQVYGAFYDEYARLNAFLHSHSYSGNALACAAALESLAIFRDEQVLQRNRALAAQLQTALQSFASHPNVSDVRQTGMIAAVEFVRDRRTRSPFDWQERRHLRIYRHALARGVLLRPLGNVIYFMPPYVITSAELHHVVAVAHEGLELALCD